MCFCQSVKLDGVRFATWIPFDAVDECPHQSLHFSRFSRLIKSIELFKSIPQSCCVKLAVKRNQRLLKLPLFEFELFLLTLEFRRFAAQHRQKRP